MNSKGVFYWALAVMALLFGLPAIFAVIGVVLGVLTSSPIVGAIAAAATLSIKTIRSPWLQAFFGGKRFGLKWALPTVIIGCGTGGYLGTYVALATGGFLGLVYGTVVCGLLSGILVYVGARMRPTEKNVST